MGQLLNRLYCQWKKGWGCKLCDVSQWVYRKYNEINHIPIISALVKRLCQLSVPLEFIEFTNNSRNFIGLLDSGAQLNVINANLLKKMEYEVYEATPLFPSLQGIQGHESKIVKWITITVLLANGQREKITMAVINDLSNSIIFGRPFLLQVQAIVDHSNGILTTSRGPICLIEAQPKEIAINSVLVPNGPKIDAPVLDEDQFNKLVKLLNEFSSLWVNQRKGLAKALSHKILLNTTQPVNCRPRRYTPEQQVAIEKEVDKMLLDNIVQPSHSPYASEVLLVKKKTNEWRVCVDYRQLNEITIRDRYPFPRIGDLLYRIQNSRYFVALDLRAGYWQIPMDHESRKYTAFRSFKGLYEFLVMPFGLTNAPATFQRAMDNLLGDLYFIGVIVYLDDILIHGRTFEETLGLLRKVFERLEEAGFTINLEKCRFFPQQLKYLGHVVEDGSMYPDIEKVQVLQQIQKPTNIKEVRSLLGMLGYYQQYIKEFSEIMSPVFELLRLVPNTKRNNKSTQIVWSTEHDTALAKAVERLATSVLKIPLDSEEFLLETDSSNFALSAILNCRQANGEWAPVEFASKKLSDTQQRWSTREKEAFAIVFGLKKYEHYLRGRAFTVYSDHATLKWMLGTKEGKVARWASRMAEFDMTIIPKKGTEIIHVDFFSRYVETEQDADLQDRMIYSIYTNTQLPTIEQVLEQQQKELPPVGKGYFIRDGKWYFRNGLWAPISLRIKIMAACHSLSPLRHPGVKKTKTLINKVFNWPNIHEDVTKYIKGCLVCQQSRPGLDRLQGLFRTHPIPGPFQTVYMDYWSCDYQGHRTVLTMIDQFTKWAECVPIDNKAEPTVTSAFVKSWICRFGVPQVVITDNDKTFGGTLFKAIANRLGITTLRTTVYHPEGNAPIESFHRVLRKGLIPFLNDKTERIPFDEALQLVLMSYRCTIHSTTNESPGFLTYGMDLQSPVHNDWRFIRNKEEQDRLQYLNNMRLDIQFQAIKNIELRNRRTNEGRIDKGFDVNELVLTRNTPFEISQLAHQLGSRKLTPRWSIPCRIIRVFPGQKKAIARNLISGKLKEVHIQDVRFIAFPQGDEQKQEWEKILVNAEISLQDPASRDLILNKFWQDLEYPQADNIENPRGQKRRAIEGSGGEK